MNKVYVQLLNDRGEHHQMQVLYSERPPWFLCIDSAVTGKHNFEDSNLFECLVSARKLIEPSGWRLLCNGSRVDAFASNMSRESGGTLLTLLSINGRPQTKDDLVFIFDEAPLDLVGTIEKQGDYVNRFFRGGR